MSYGFWDYPRYRKTNKNNNRTPGKRMKFGQTWWGEQWLNALSHIDYDNRLPRGRAYAGNGSVQDIQIKENKITAKVQGSRATPYKVKVVIPEITLQQQETLVDKILNNPLMLSRLLNREMPQELVRLTKDEHIKLFPDAWKDLQMDCSCPDWAVPCKHLAAVIYLIANEIDANPFILFNLRGLNLIGELKKHHSGIGEHASEPIPEMVSFFVENPIAHPESADFSVANLPDFSVISNQTSRIFTLLSAKPLFSGHDFKTILQSVYKYVVKFPWDFASGTDEKFLTEYGKKIESFDDVMILLDQDSRVGDVVLIRKGRKQDHEERVAWLDFLGLLEILEPAVLENCNEALQGIALHYRFARILAERGAILPQLLKNSEGNYLIRWIPAENDPAIQPLSRKMERYASPGTVWIWSEESIDRGKYHPLTASENSRMITASILGSMIGDIGSYTGNAEKDRSAVSDMFFRLKPYDFSGLTEKQIPNTIQLWLKPLSRSTRRWQPIVQIEEKQNNYYLNILATNTESAIPELIPLADILREESFQPVRLDLLRDLSQLTAYLPDLGFYLQISGRQPMQFNPIDFFDVFKRALPILRLLGIGILMPKALEKLLVPKPSLRLTTSGEKNSSFINLHEMLGFEYQVAIGNEVISIEEFRRLVKGLSGIVKIKDQYVLLSNDAVEKILRETSAPAKLGSHELLRAALAEEYNGAAITLDAAVKRLIKKMTSSEDIPVPDGITASLRPYQTTGFRWMARQSKIGFGSLIADDMGLGKTLQVIAVLMKFKLDGLLKKEKALIVVPTTLLTNWEKEVQKFAPELTTTIYHGSNRRLNLKEADLVLTTYGMVRSDLKILKAHRWHAVVIDEAQNIKNASTDQTKAVKSLKSAIRIAMSGTPVENRLSEYWSIMDFVNPGYLGSAKNFADEFANPIQLSNDQHKTALFRKITAPFILRRLKTDKSIISDLPDKVEINRYCHLTGDQAALYQNMVNSAMKTIEESDGIQRRGLVLKMITALKQICNHPGNFLKTGKPDPNLSGKSTAMMELLDQIHESGEKTLIFTQYQEMGNILLPMIEKQFGAPPLFLHGGTSRKQRDEMVEEFQQNRHTRIFILSLKAGGTGLNLTAANHVIHYDFWWNPAVESQATDRAYRIGQHKNVMVNRLLTRGTFEEKIDEMLRHKKELANLTVTTGEKWIGELSDRELKEVFRLET